MDERTSYDSSTLSYNGDDLTEGTHYAVDVVDGLVTYTFDTGYFSANPGGELIIDVVVTVDAVGDDGIITNTAFINTNGRIVESNEVQTEWGGVKLVKHVTGDTAKTLTGAVFQVFATEADAVAKANPIAINGVSEFTTDDAGEIVIDGLKIGNYWIVETKSPAGYRLNQDPIAVTVVSGGLTAYNIYNVANAPVPPFSLPLTGAVGTAVFTGSGLLLMAGAAVAAVTLRRRMRLHRA